MGITTLLTQNFPKDLVAALFFDTRSTLNRTVFDSGRHCPARARRQHSQTTLHGLRTNSDRIANLNPESRRHVSRKILVPFLISVCKTC